MTLKSLEWTPSKNYNSARILSTVLILTNKSLCYCTHFIDGFTGTEGLSDPSKSINESLMESQEVRMSAVEILAQTDSLPIFHPSVQSFSSHCLPEGMQCYVTAWMSLFWSSTFLKWTTLFYFSEMVQTNFYALLLWSLSCWSSVVEMETAQTTAFVFLLCELKWATEVF